MMSESMRQSLVPSILVFAKCSDCCRFPEIHIDMLLRQSLSNLVGSTTWTLNGQSRICCQSWKLVMTLIAMRCGPVSSGIHEFRASACSAGSKTLCSRPRSKSNYPERAMRDHSHI